MLRFERTGINALPSLRTVFDRSWIVRIARGTGGASMKRANSVTCLDPDDGDDVPARIAWIEAIYRRFHLPAMFRVTPLTPPALDAALTERGYPAEDERIVLRAELTPPLRALKDGFADQPAVGMVRVVAHHDDAAAPRRDPRIDRVAGASRRSIRCCGTRAPRLRGAGDDRRALCRDFRHLDDPAARRAGLARQIMFESMTAAASRGARTAWLQLPAANTAALALYRSLGFGEAYRYRFRAK